MSNIIPFDFDKLPAHVAIQAAEANDDLSAGVRSGFPVISIEGKVFRLKRGDERTLITNPGSDDPAPALEVILLKANPNLSKTYYAKGYTPGTDEKPACYSNDGVAPAADAQVPQAKHCATCKWNEFGSRITDNGKKAKACSDFRRVAIAAPNHVNDPMLLRVPATTLPALAEYGAMLRKRGVKYTGVVTRVGFDYTVTHPQLTFKPVGFVDAATAAEIVEIAASDLVAQIVGLAPVYDAGGAETAEAFEKPPVEPLAPTPEPKAEKPARTKKTATGGLDAALAAAEAAPKAKVKVEGEEPAAPTTTSAASEVKVATGSLAEELDALLGGLDLDD